MVWCGMGGDTGVPGQAAAPRPLLCPGSGWLGCEPLWGAVEVWGGFRYGVKFTFQSCQ